MIITVAELRRYVPTDKDDLKLEAMLQALETSIRNYTNNDFAVRGFKEYCEIKNGTYKVQKLKLNVGDTVKVSKSIYNDGLYEVTEVTSEGFKVDGATFDELTAYVSLVKYPADVKFGVVNMIKWQLRNESAAHGKDRQIASESISRHSVSYEKDGTESDINKSLGVPNKYANFLKAYRKVRIC